MRAREISKMKNRIKLNADINIRYFSRFPAFFVFLFMTFFSPVSPGEILIRLGFVPYCLRTAVL